jgi:hypothetical protein
MFFSKKNAASTDSVAAAAKAQAAKDLGIADPEGRLNHTQAVALAALLAAGEKGSPAYEAVLQDFRDVMGQPNSAS